MRSLAATGLLVCVSLLSSASARRENDRTASVHLLGPRSSSSTSQHAETHHNTIVNGAASSSVSASYSPSDANALISSFLRIEEYEVLRDGLQVPEQLTMQPFEQEREAGNAEPLMVLAEDMSSSGISYLLPSLQAEDGTLSKRLLHSFNVESTPGPRAWMELLETYRDRIAEKFGLTLKDQNASSIQEKRMMMPPVPGSLGDNMALGPELVDDVRIISGSIFGLANADHGLNRSTCHT